MLNEISQTEKNNYCMISLMWNLKKQTKFNRKRYRKQTAGCQRGVELGASKIGEGD